MTLLTNLGQGLCTPRPVAPRRAVFSVSVTISMIYIKKLWWSYPLQLPFMFMFASLRCNKQSHMHCGLYILPLAVAFAWRESPRHGRLCSSSTGCHQQRP